jgi:putative flippase GtrA
MATLSERLRSKAIRPTEWIEQGAKFLLVGLMNTGIDIGLYFALTRLLAVFAEANVVAKGISYGAGVLNSYLWNRSWTFKSRDRSWKTFTPFVLSNLIGLSINAALLWLGLLFSIHEILALLIATSVTLLWNFIISKLVVFNR